MIKKIDIWDISSKHYQISVIKKLEYGRQALKDYQLITF